MSLLEDLGNEITAYPREQLTLALVEIDPAGPGSTINQFEDVQFRISVQNNGHLDVLALALKVEAGPDAEVKSNGVNADWGASFNTTAGFFPTIFAKQRVVSGLGKFHFRSLVESATPRDLVKIYVTGWSTNFDHLWGAHTDRLDDPIFVYQSEVEDD
jgi:hypothetical protein